MSTRSGLSSCDGECAGTLGPRRLSGLRLALPRASDVEALQ
jgi:hypothetical protein